MAPQLLPPGMAWLGAAAAEHPLLQSRGLTAAAGLALLALLLPSKLRRLAWDVVETVLASLLLLVLVGVVLGLPFGEGGGRQGCWAASGRAAGRRIAAASAGSPR